MDLKKMRKARAASGAFSAVALLLGAAVFTLLALRRWELRGWFPAESLLGYVLIAALWWLEALCAVLRLLLLPEPKPAKFPGRGGRPYDRMLLALSCLEHDDRAEALSVLEKVDSGRLKKRGLARVRELRRLAEGAETEDYAGALYQLSEDLRKDTERISRRHRLLGSLPRAALLSLALLAAMRLPQRELPSRCAELHSELSLREEAGAMSRFTLDIRSEAAPQGGQNEAEVTLAYRREAEGEPAREAENQFYIQSPAREAPDCDRFVYTPKSLMDPERYALPFPDTYGFASLYQAAAKAVQGAKGQEDAYQGRPCQRLQGELPAKALEAVFQYAAGLADPSLYREEQVWAPALPDAAALSGADPLPLTVWAESGGGILGASVDLTPLLSGLSLLEEEPPRLEICFLPYDPAYVALPESGAPF